MIDKLVVTGGLGFIGSNLVDILVDKGYEVVVVDNNIQSPYHNKSARYFYNDITKPIEEHYEIFHNAKAVFHLAAEIYIQKSLDDPDLFFNVNVGGTKNILNYCIQHDVKKFIFSSTSAIYGNAFSGYPSKETDKVDLLNAYSQSKHLAEKVCSMYKDINISVLRYFNVYGNRQNESGQYAPAIGKFLSQKNNKQPITVNGDGSQKRDFVNVFDVCEANYLAYLNNKEFNIYNIGYGDNISILDLANMIDSNIVFMNPKMGEARETLADISKASKNLKWKPSISVKKYLQSM